MDNPSMESSSDALNQDQAIAVFANLLDPAEVEANTEVEPEKEKESEDTASEETPAEASDESAEEQAEASEEEQTVTIKIDGKDVEVPITELKNGYQRQADYTRKTMEVAEQRKAADADLSNIAAERMELQASLAKAQAVLESSLETQKNIDWENLIRNDPNEYLLQKHLFDQRQADLRQNLQDQSQISQKISQDQQQNYQNYLAKQQDELLAKLPSWKNPEVAKAEKLAIREYLLTNGFDQKQVDTVADAKAVQLALKAMKYDEMISKASVATKQVQKLPTKVEKPSAGERPPSDKFKGDLNRLSKSGKIDDAVRVFSNFI